MAGCSTAIDKFALENVSFECDASQILNDYIVQFSDSIYSVSIRTWRSFCDNCNHIPKARRSTSIILASGHTHGADDTHSATPHDGNKFSSEDKETDERLRKEIAGYMAGYLATTNGTLMKHWYDSNDSQWKIITFRGDRYQLPSDANDPTHGAYTCQDISKKYDNLSWLQKLFLTKSRFLGRMDYK